MGFIFPSKNRSVLCLLYNRHCFDFIALGPAYFRFFPLVSSRGASSGQQPLWSIDCEGRRKTSHGQVGQFAAKAKCACRVE